MNLFFWVTNFLKDKKSPEGGNSESMSIYSTEEYVVFFSVTIVTGYRNIFDKQDNLIKGNWTVKANKRYLPLIKNWFLKKTKPTKPKETISISFNFIQIMLPMLFTCSEHPGGRQESYLFLNNPETGRCISKFLENLSHMQIKFHSIRNITTKH